MVITIVSDILGQANNGTTITCMRLIKGLKARGHEVRVVSPLVTDEEGYYTLPLINFHMFNKYVESNGVALAKPIKDVLVKAFTGCDIVHIMLPFKVGIYARKLAQEMNLPVTGATHCQAQNVTAQFKLQNSKFANKFVYKEFNKRFYQYLDYVHCPTEFIKDEIIKAGFKNNIKVISNGVAPSYHKKEVARPSKYKDKFIILTVGRLAREKRHDLLIEAIAHSKYNKDIVLFIAGRGPLLKKTIKLGNKLANKPVISFYSQEDLVNLLNYSDLYVHPADIEIEAISCLEALSCGLVPIISDSKDSATNRFALHEDNLFKAGDPVDLAKKIDYLIEHKDIREKESREYLEYSKRFNIDSCIDQMVEMFKEAIKIHNDKSRG